MKVHDTSFIWVESVTTGGFKACLVLGGQGNGGNTTIDWFAFQGSQSGVYDGSAKFNLFTTGTQCKKVKFPKVRLKKLACNSYNTLENVKKRSSRDVFTFFPHISSITNFVKVTSV